MDRITLDIIWGKLQATADEMGVVLAKASMSPVIYEVLDFAAGICDMKGEMIAVQNGITIFTGTFSDDIKAIKAKFKKDINEGDIFLYNLPHKSGTHLNDVSVVKPVFVKSKLIAFAVADAHWADIGGSVTGSTSPQATDIYQEGLQLPGVRLYKKGELQTDVQDIIESNVRFKKMALGDLNAEVASVNIAELRIKEVVDKYGQHYLLDAFEYIKSYGEKLSLEKIKKMRNDTLNVSDFIDGDGFTSKQIPIKLKLIIKDEEIEFDFTGTASEGDSPLKCGRGALFSMVKSIFKAVVDPHGPANEGWFKHLKLTIPDGTVFSATYPNSTGWYFEIASQAADLVWRAFSSLNFNNTSAGSYVSLAASFIYGTDHRNDKPFMIVEPHAGGWGAMDDADGASGLIAILDGDTYNYSIELFEAKFPIRCHRYELNTLGGSGHGKYRGGFGIVREYEILCKSAYTYCNIGRSVTEPWGLHGGSNGSTNYMLIKSKKGGVKKVSRIPPTRLDRGTKLEIVTGGGGGYGDPKERDKASIKSDIQNDLLSPSEAKSVYKFSYKKCLD